LIARARARASSVVLCIFQLPAMTGILMFRIQNPGRKGSDPENLVFAKTRYTRSLGRQKLNFQGQTLSVRAATPGRVRPARNSKQAPPPVETCEIRSAT